MCVKVYITLRSKYVIVCKYLLLYKTFWCVICLVLIGMVPFVLCKYHQHMYSICILLRIRTSIYYTTRVLFSIAFFFHLHLCLYLYLHLSKYIIYFLVNVNGYLNLLNNNTDEKEWEEYFAWPSKIQFGILANIKLQLLLISTYFKCVLWIWCRYEHYYAVCTNVC